MNGERVIDVPTADKDEPAYEGKVMVVFALDPGVSTGWSALKVPVGLLSGGTVARTLVRCRHHHGTIRRSASPRATPAGAAYDSTDSAHVDAILAGAREIYEEWMPDEEEEDAEDYRFVFVMEGFDLRMISMDPSLLAPIRVASIFMDRLYTGQSPIPNHFQKVSDAKNVVTDARLRGWGLWDVHASPHARDADRHAILFLRRFASVASLRRSIFDEDPLEE